VFTQAWVDRSRRRRSKEKEVIRTDTGLACMVLFSPQPPTAPAAAASVQLSSQEGRGYPERFGLRGCC
jgi:hypothetical protein